MNKTPSVSNTEKTEGQFVSELAEARRRIAELEASAAERKQAEEARRKSEERFRLLVEHYLEVEVEIHQCTHYG